MFNSHITLFGFQYDGCFGLPSGAKRFIEHLRSRLSARRTDRYSIVTMTRVRPSATRPRSKKSSAIKPTVIIPPLPGCGLSETHLKPLHSFDVNRNATASRFATRIYCVAKSSVSGPEVGQPMVPIDCSRIGLKMPSRPRIQMV